MSTDHFQEALANLATRALPGGGFCGQPSGQYRPDATAWAALALRVFDQPSSAIAPHLAKLRGSQLADGRIAIAPDYPQAFWPTAEAIFAWQGSAENRQPQQNAADFLLRTTGKHFKRSKQLAKIMGHDPSIRGWPWIEDTHSWVEPTAMNLMALALVGEVEHARCQEARRMLMNRQLESGGWNYGNTKTFCLELRPSMESSGLALHALAGHVPQADVQHSIDYLERELPRTRTPLWLAWSVLGLSAWNRRPAGVEEAVAECLARQTDYGSYDTAWLGALLLAAACKSGLVAELSGATTPAEVA